MLILLPPSEGKTAPAPALDDPSADLSPVDLDSLSLPELAGYRRKVVDALAEVSARPDALDVLGVPPSLGAEVARNVALLEAPAARAHDVYTGVLYAAARLGSAPADGQASAAVVGDRLRSDVRTVSALWGLVGPLDRIPAYRLSMGTDLPGVGPLARFWRPALAQQLAPRVTHDVVIDCRSAAYTAAWRPAAGVDWVAVRVLRELDGRRTVVSHNAKHARGLLTGHLVRRPGAPPRTADELADAARELVGHELLEARLLDAARGPRVLELVVA